MEPSRFAKRAKIDEVIALMDEAERAGRSRQGNATWVRRHSEHFDSGLVIPVAEPVLANGAIRCSVLLLGARGNIAIQVFLDLSPMSVLLLKRLRRVELAALLRRLASLQAGLHMNETLIPPNDSWKTLEEE
ncbi:hypothetical protein [Streptomyces sp. ICBB 8177]|uniref:hypothetical protein n=1 Tax=Streptomyces sp. ICBB 8177 TaxID=563922 RepID=UPI0011B5913D|nr:hypothetical protein [Streptomyces sp. ICBB 8177]